MRKSQVEPLERTFFFGLFCLLCLFLSDHFHACVGKCSSRILVCKHSLLDRFSVSQVLPAAGGPQGVSGQEGQRSPYWAKLMVSSEPRPVSRRLLRNLHLALFHPPSFRGSFHFPIVALHLYFPFPFLFWRTGAHTLPDKVYPFGMILPTYMISFKFHKIFCRHF